MKTKKEKSAEVKIYESYTESLVQYGIIGYFGMGCCEKPFSESEFDMSQIAFIMKNFVISYTIHPKWAFEICIRAFSYLEGKVDTAMIADAIDTAYHEYESNIICDMIK